MDSFVFNNFKERLLSVGETRVKNIDTWKFYPVSSELVDDFGDLLPYIKNLSDLDSIIKHKSKTNNISSYLCEYLPVYYTYKKSTDTVSADMPDFVDRENWDEFIAAYPNNYALYDMFLSDTGVFHRVYESDKKDENDNNILVTRGFYFVRTSEELKWCADKVNGEINNNRTDIYNNEINIVLGDNIGHSMDNTVASWEYYINSLNSINGLYNITRNYDYSDNKKMSFTIGKYIDRPFNGIFFGNGFKIQNVTVECSGDSSGIIGYLGNKGWIDCIRIEGHNVLKCNKKISLDHLINGGGDVNAGLICGKNDGTVTDVYGEFSLSFDGFVPKVYTVSNKTENGNAFDKPQVNKYFPNYLCINSLGNIVPYVGYFAEGVFATYARESEDKGFWKSDYYSTGIAGIEGDNEFSPWFPYDNEGCALWAFPDKIEWPYNKQTKEVENTPKYVSRNGHAIFYDINIMEKTQKLLGLQLSDWRSGLSMIPSTKTDMVQEETDGPYTHNENWKLEQCDYMDKSVKMHQFNRVSYNTGSIIGCNCGEVRNIAIKVNGITTGTYVGFIGGIIGKQAAVGKNIVNVDVDFHIWDAGSRDRYVSDDGDSYTMSLETGWIIACIPTYGSGIGLNNISLKENNQYIPNLPDLYRLGQANANGEVNFGAMPAFRFGINQTSFEKIEITKDTDGNDVETVSAIKMIHKGSITPEMFEFGEKWTERGTNVPELFGSMTSSEMVSWFNTRQTGHMTPDTKKDYELSDFIKQHTQLGLIPYCAANISLNTDWRSYGIAYRFGRIGQNVFSSVNKFDDPTKNYTGDIAYCSYDKVELAPDQSGFILRNVKFKVYGISYDKSVPGDIKTDAHGIIDITHKDGTLNDCWVNTIMVEELYVCGKPLGGTQIIPEYNGPYADKVNFIYGNKIFTYNLFDILKAKNIHLTVCKPDNGNVDVWDLVIPEIKNNEKVRGKKFTEADGEGSYLSNYEVENTPTISWLESKREVVGCKNYNIELKSIKNVGALCGSLVVTNGQLIQGVRAILNNHTNYRFLETANTKCYDGDEYVFNGPDGEPVELPIQVFGDPNDTTDYVDYPSGWIYTAVNSYDASGNPEYVRDVIKRRPPGWFKVGKAYKYVIDPTTGERQLDPDDPEGKTYLKEEVQSVTCGYLIDDAGNVFGNTEPFRIEAGMLIGWYYGSVMYAMPITETETNMCDYAFDNRFGGLAAVCELNSAMISDFATINDLEKKFITLQNVTFGYKEDISTSEYGAGAVYRRYGVMGLVGQNIPEDGKVRYPYGVASPFIGEIKPTFLTIPSIIETQGTLLKDYAHGDDISDEDYYQSRVGLFTMDQNFAAPDLYPHIWTINEAVDLPGMVGYVVGQVDGINTNVGEFSPDLDHLIDFIFKYEQDDITLLKCNGGKIIKDYDPTKLLPAFTTTVKDLDGNDKIMSYGLAYEDESAPLNKLVSLYKINDKDLFARGNGYGVTDVMFTTVGTNFTLRANWTPDSSTVVADIQNKVINPYTYFGSVLELQTNPYENYYPQASNDNIIASNIINNKSLGGFWNNLNTVETNYNSKIKYISDLVININTSNANVWFNPTNVNTLYPLISANYLDANTVGYLAGDDKFKYNFDKTFGQASRAAFEYPVELTEYNNMFGFWTSDNINETYPNGEIYRYYNDDIVYDGSVVHIGTVVNEACIMRSLNDGKNITTSGISAENFGGILVTDSNDRAVMYIDVNFGDCDGSRSWTLNCETAKDATGNAKALLLGVN